MEKKLIIKQLRPMTLPFIKSCYNTAKKDFLNNYYYWLLSPNFTHIINLNTKAQKYVCLLKTPVQLEVLSPAASYYKPSYYKVITDPIQIFKVNSHTSFGPCCCHIQYGTIITTLFVIVAKLRTCIRYFRSANVVFLFGLTYTKEPCILVYSTPLS